jgi:NAD(P)-dependent dehydrogenase (short-subunit alcohol dehydrogenase family)
MDVSVTGMHLQGKVAIVTGSTRGWGEGIARRLARDGAAVVVSGRRETEGAHAAQGIEQAGGRAVFVRADVSREADCAGLIRATVDRFGRLDIQVNNAGITLAAPFEQQTVPRVG